MLFGNHYSQSNPDPTALDASKRSKLVRARARLGVRVRVRVRVGVGGRVRVGFRVQVRAGVRESSSLRPRGLRLTLT